jgi:hypothetical protein
MSLLGTVAVNLVELTYVVVSFAPFHSIESMFPTSAGIAPISFWGDCAGPSHLFPGCAPDDRCPKRSRGRRQSTALSQW